MKDIIIIGAGGHASVIIDIIESMKNTGHEVRIIGLLDDRKDITKFMGYKILDEINNAPLYSYKDTEFVIAIVLASGLFLVTAGSFAFIIDEFDKLMPLYKFISWDPIENNYIN